MRSVPGVENASEVFIVPLSGPEWSGRIQVGGVAQDPLIYFNAVGEEYFRTTDTPVILGRSFDTRDGAGGQKVAVVSDTFARQIFGTREAVGRRFALEVPPGQTAPSYDVIGVVADTKYDDVREEPRPIAYLSMAQEEQAPGFFSVVVRTDLPSASVLPALTREVTAAAPGASVSYSRVTEYVEVLLRTDRLMTTLAGLFGVLALLISLVGLYGLTSFMVTRRRVEIGIRMALGAQPLTIVRMMLRESALLVALGAVAGLGLAVVASRYAARLLYGVTALDPASFGLALLTLASVALLASWIPARRAAEVPPTVALRE
jgi:predicted permease